MKKYQALVLLGVMFLLLSSAVLAKVILNQNWYTGGVTNRGAANSTDQRTVASKT